MANIKIYHDAETRSVIPLDTKGSHAYFRDQSTDCLMLSYAIEIDGRIVESINSVSRFYPQWGVEFVCPPALRYAVSNGALLYAHNATFEFDLWRQILGPRYEWPVPAQEQMRCTMAMCAAMGLPLSLDNAAKALGLPVQKDHTLHQNMMRMCKPRSPRKGEDPAKGPYWFNEKDRWPKLQRRCEDDVLQEIQLCYKIRNLSPAELAIYQMDQRINARGMSVDIELAQTAADMIVEVTKAMNDEIRELTDGAISAVTEVQNLKEWLQACLGVYYSELRADDIDKLLLMDGLPAKAKRVLELRQAGSKISTRKVNAFLKNVESDGRTRNWCQYHGAMPGRWAARRIQVQNIKRPTIDKSVVPIAIETVKRGDIDWCQRMFGEPMELISNILRGCIVAAPGYRLIASDYSNIQGRLCAWYSDQHDKLQAFAAYDAKTGPDLYNVAYGQVFAKPAHEVTDTERQVGKVIELSMGFEGGPAAFESMAKIYRVNIEDQFEHIFKAIGTSAGLNGQFCIYEESERAWDSYGHKSEMLQRKWLAAEMIKRVWRRENPAISQTWAALKDAAIEAVYQPDTTCWVNNKIAYRMHGEHLACRLPDGKVIWYLHPELRETELPWSTPDKPAKAVSLTYMRTNPTTKQWERTYTHGGKQMENICLGGERQLLAQAMQRLEARGDGYERIVLHTHDEVVIEMPIGQGSLAEMNAIMMDVQPWVAGCPIKSDGWEGHEYRKG